MTPKNIAFYIAGELVSLAGMAVALFWAAGTLIWWPAWADLAVMLGWMVGMAVVMFRLHPDLLLERMLPPKEAKRWDRLLMINFRLLTLAGYIIAGLDQRHAWSGGISLSAQLLALAACALGYALFTWAAAANPFCSQIVRLQAERGHSVAEGGPYRYVRHPSYLGVILYELAVSILLASWWALIPSLICVLLMILRTTLEDRTLKAELAGYADYTRQVRWRLLPGIW